MQIPGARTFRYVYLSALLCAAGAPGTALAEIGAEPIRQAQALFQQGAYHEAARLWEKALAGFPPGHYRHIDLLMRLTAAYQALGDYTSAYAALRKAQPLAEQHGTPAQQALLHSYAGDVLLGLGQPEAAKAQLERAVRQARALDMPAVLAHALNNLGNYLSAEASYKEAQAAYQEAAALAGDTPLHLQISGNRVRAALRQGDRAASLTLWRAFKTQIEHLPADRAQARHLLTLAELALQRDARFPGERALLQETEGLLQRARRLAEAAGDSRLKSYATGYLGQVAARSGADAQALPLFREAIFLSQEQPDLLYRWEWRQGRVHQSRGETGAAEQAYRRALQHLQRIRADLGTGRRDAREQFYADIRPVYYSLADILLQQAAGADPARRQNLLAQSRDTLEQLKLAEFQNYFQDPCLAGKPGTALQLDKLPPRTAVLYPVILPERLELLLSLPDGVTRQIVVPVTGEKIEDTVRAFQLNVQTRSSWRLIEQARPLYDWLIAPLQADLASHQVDTLLVVPDSYLRMIPLAALHDGKKFLVESLAVATIPSLRLTDAQALSRQDARILLTGLSEGVQDFPALPNVRQEIASLETLFKRPVVLMDQNFLLANVDHTLEGAEYTVVHVASHGQFSRELKNTFLLTYDAKLTMDHLERLLRVSQAQDRPVELLTLSACQTAVGDERAALGLAGVALKSGSRSALASLWFVSDESTAQLITAFYKHLQEAGSSKARALQLAQQEVMRARQFQHPAYWAPFLLIGNWL